MRLCHPKGQLGPSLAPVIATISTAAAATQVFTIYLPSPAIVPASMPALFLFHKLSSTHGSAN